MRTLTGTIRLHRSFHSRHLPDDRDIIVYLPPRYAEDDERRYPVFYLHDGQNMFDAATAFLGQEWHADEIAEDLIQSGAIEPLIMVGIYNAGERRIDEYTPTRGSRTEAAPGGRARLHAAMIVEEVKPLIDAEYRTLTTSSCTGLGGSSLGGLATLYAGLRNPHVFGKLAVLSPSVWWRNGVILRMIRDIRAQEPRPKIWLDVGTAEGDDPGRCLDDARRLRDALVKHGWTLGQDMSYFEDRDAPHSEQAWTGRLPAVLRFLFGRITD